MEFVLSQYFASITTSRGLSSMALSCDGSVTYYDNPLAGCIRDPIPTAALMLLLSLPARVPGRSSQALYY